MENRLKALVTKIEASDMTDQEKEKVYQAISDSLRETVLPTLVKYMPKEQLSDLANNPSSLIVDSYGKIVEEAVRDGRALKEIALQMDLVVGKIEKLFQEKGI